jgi:hypothetical protein
MTKPDVILTLMGRFRPVPLKPISKEPAASENTSAVGGFALEHLRGGPLAAGEIKLT